MCFAQDEILTEEGAIEQIPVPPVVEVLLGSYFYFRDIPCFLKTCRPVCSVITDIAIGAGGLGFNSQSGQTGHSVVNGSPPL